MLIQLVHGGKALKVTTERLPNCEAKLIVEIEPDHVAGPLRRVARRLSRQVRISGFRPGKAPLSVIERRFGREALLEEVVESEGQSWYEEALKEVDLDPYGQAELEITSHDPLVMTFSVPVEPVVDPGEYHDIRLEWQPPVVSDQDVEKELARLQQEKASLEPRDRPAQMEDVAKLDIQARIGDELVVDVKERAVTLNPDIDYPVAGFAEKLVGLSPGEDLAFILVYPQDHPNSAWAGKEAHFDVHMHSLEAWVTPELDDALARDMGDYETLDEWRASVQEDLEAKALEQAEHDYADSVVGALVEQAHVEFPAVLVERKLDDMLQDLDQSLQQRGLGLENYLVMMGKTREEYRESLREPAESQVKRGLVLTELVKVEALEVTEADIDAEVDRMAESLGDEAENFRQVFAREEMRESIRNGLLTRVALDTLKAIAKGEYAPSSLEGPEEEKEEEEPSQEAKAETEETKDGGDEAPAGEQ